MSAAIDDLQPMEVRHKKLKQFYFAHMGCGKSPFCRATEQGNHAIVMGKIAKEATRLCQLCQLITASEKYNSM